MPTQSEDRVSAPTLPNADALGSAWTGFADLEEYVIDPIMRSVFQAVNFNGPQSITYEQIGRLAEWADSIEIMAARIAELAANMREAVIRDLPSIIPEGEKVNAARFTEFGRRLGPGEALIMELEAERAQKDADHRSD